MVIDKLLSSCSHVENEGNEKNFPNIYATNHDGDGTVAPIFSKPSLCDLSIVACEFYPNNPSRRTKKGTKEANDASTETVRVDLWLFMNLQWTPTGILLVCASADSAASRMLPRHIKIMGISKLLIPKGRLFEKFCNDDLFVIPSKVQILYLTVISE